jgi:hypothetical protein
MESHGVVKRVSGPRRARLFTLGMRHLFCVAAFVSLLVREWRRADMSFETLVALLMLGSVFVDLYVVFRRIWAIEDYLRSTRNGEPRGDGERSRA